VKTLPDFRPKRSKTKNVCRPKQLKNHTLWDGTYLYSLIGEYPPSRHLSESRFVASSIPVLHL